MKKKKNLMDFMKRIITGFMKEGRPGTAHVYQSTYNRILDFMGGRPMDFAELTPSWLKALAASVEQHFYVYADAPCRLFPGGRPGAGFGLAPAVPRCIHRYSGDGEAGGRSRSVP